MGKWNILLSRKHRLDGDIQKKPSASGVKKVCFLLFVKQKRKVVVGKFRQLLNVQNRSKYKKRGIIMKKVIAIMMVFTIILLLCACSNNSPFVGTWHGTDVDGYGCTITFKGDGTFVFDHNSYGRRTGEWESAGHNTAKVIDNSNMIFTFTIDHGVMTGSAERFAGSPMTFTK